MINKRFWIFSTLTECSGIKDKDKLLTFDEVVDLLNEQHEQIEDLKDANVRCCNEYSYFHKRMMELEKENEQLKQQLKTKVVVNRQYEELQKLKKENEYLKQQIKELYNFVKCDVDNEIDVYPKCILEYLVNILKIIGDVE